MLFFEYSFLFLFLPVVLVGYYVLPRRMRNAWLLVASCGFYSASSWIFLPVLLASAFVDYFAGAGIARAQQKRGKKAWLGLSLFVNLGSLAFFKYVGLITITISDLIGPGFTPIIEAALPVGISFYTFQSMSYTIDVYRGRVQPIRSVVDFATYITMFPQLVAGPIVRFSHIHEQLVNRIHSLDKFARGLFLFVAGMAKKILVADTLAILAEPLFAEVAPTGAQAWVSMFFFAGQIYFDFSGYSDMAIGLGRMFGFEFPINFNSPYVAESFSDFWRRWHISLSTWLRDYLYIPLGGNRHGSIRTYFNLSATMLLGGLWHGATWNFVLWGAAHGFLLAIERALKGICGGVMPPLLARRAIVFLCVTLVWVPFKFDHIERTQTWLAAMFGGGDVAGGVTGMQLLALGGLGVLFWCFRNTTTWAVKLQPWQIAAGLLLFLVTILVAYGRVELSPFLYFRF